MLYISTQVRRKWPHKTWQMECLATLPQPAQPQPGISPIMSWTDADTHAGANLQGCGNLGDGAGPMYASSSGPVSSRHPPNARFATTQSRRMPKITRIKLTKTAVNPIIGRINAPRLPNKGYQKLQPPALTDKRESDCPSPTTSSTAVAATWTSAPNATSTTPTISCISTTFSSSDLATLIYATFILDHWKSN